MMRSSRAVNSSLTAGTIAPQAPEDPCRYPGYIFADVAGDVAPTRYAFTPALCLAACSSRRNECHHTCHLSGHCRQAGGCRCWLLLRRFGGSDDHICRAP